MGQKAGKTTKRPRTGEQAAKQRARTARNKLKAVEKALATAGGGAVAFLEGRRRFWKEQVRKGG